MASSEFDPPWRRAALAQQRQARRDAFAEQRQEQQDPTMQLWQRVRAERKERACEQSAQRLPPQQLLEEAEGEGDQMQQSVDAALKRCGLLEFCSDASKDVLN